MPRRYVPAVAAVLLCLTVTSARAQDKTPVSYTHLTLPTSDLV